MIESPACQPSSPRRSKESGLVEGEARKKKRKDTHPESSRCRSRGLPFAPSPSPTLSFKWKRSLRSVFLYSREVTLSEGRKGVRKNGRD